MKKSTKTTKTSRPPLSPEARAKIAAAQKKRWAKFKKEKKGRPITTDTLATDSVTTPSARERSPFDARTQDVLYIASEITTLAAQIGLDRVRLDYDGGAYTFQLKSMPITNNR
jgi:hypothetical protein